MLRTEEVAEVPDLHLATRSRAIEMRGGRSSGGEGQVDALLDDGEKSLFVL